MSRSIVRTLVVIVVALFLGRADLPSQTRDAPVTAKTTGSGSIAGTITTDDAAHKPLRRASVTLAESTGVMPSRMAVTNDAGRFSFRDLPVGRFTVTAVLTPYLASSYGARKVPGPGSVTIATPIALADGEQLKDITIRLARGGVIAGTVRDIDGQAMRGAYVSVAYFRRSPTTGERSLTPAGQSGSTDDRGAYRIFGLRPGEYVVTASGGIGGFGNQEVTLTSDEEVRRALDLIQRPGSATPAEALQSPALKRTPTAGYPQVFFPGVTAPERAVTVSVGVGEERSPIDMQLQRVPALRIEGSVIGIDGSPAARAMVSAYASDPSTRDFLRSGGSTQTDAQGRFRLGGLLPGNYSVLAATSGPQGGLQVWAQSAITLSSDDAALTLMLQPTMSLTGRVVIDPSSGGTPPDVTKLRVMLLAMAGDGYLPLNAVIGNSVVQPTGEFTILGVLPGRYRLGMAFTAPQGAWVASTSTIRGEESLDSPVEIRPGEAISDATIVMTTRATEISGTLTDASGGAAPDYFIIVFADDPAQWGIGSRRIQQTRPSSDGKFLFKNLPAGSYRLAAVTDVEQGEWFDPVFLRQLIDSSVRFSLGPNEKKTQDIRIR